MMKENQSTPTHQIEEARAEYSYAKKQPHEGLNTEYLEQLVTANNNEIRRLLTNIMNKEKETSLRYFVAQQALIHKTAKSFFYEILEYGCTNEAITEAIESEDPRQFFNDHYDEIEIIRQQMEDSQLFPKPMGDRRNWLTTTAVEATAFVIAHEIGLKVQHWHLCRLRISPLVFKN